MGTIWTSTGPYFRVEYGSEADLEATILRLQRDLFGPNRIYLDVKKKIGAKAGLRNIPDGYLLDLSGRSPRLYVVENELAAHDPLRHIAVQILQFSLSFEAEPRTVKGILFDAIQLQQNAKKLCDEYVSTHTYRNLDHLLDSLVFDAPFAALVIIDSIPETLENVLASKFRFGVEVLELARYANAHGNHIYQFEPFLVDVSGAVLETATGPITTPSVDASEIDTVVVPAREDGFRAVFLNENRWYQIRLHGAMRPQIKYIAAYQVAPVSAITHIAPVRSIEPWKDSGKFVVNFAEPAKQIGPIPLIRGGRVRQLQSLRYTTRAHLESAKSLDDVW